MGSTREAFHAGNRQAQIENTTRVPTAAQKLNRSSGLTSNNKFESDLVTASAPAIQKIEPTAISARPSRKTLAITRARVAPSAIRIPNSRVRCEVA